MLKRSEKPNSLFFAACYLAVTFSYLYYLSRAIFIRMLHVDEPQNLYVVWAGAFLDKQIYLDYFDNHGPLYAFLGGIFLKLVGAEPFIEPFLWLRGLNVALTGCVLLLSGFALYSLQPAGLLVLLPLLYAVAYSSYFGVQIRPDMLQLLFMLLGLLLSLYAIKKRRLVPSLAAGFFVACMLLTNIKSLVVLAGFILSLLSLAFLNRNDRFYLKLLFCFLAAAAVSFVLILAAVLPIDALKGYYRYNLLFNFLIVLHPLKNTAYKVFFETYINRQLGLSLLFLAGFLVWSFNAFKTRDPSRIIISILTGTILAGKSAGLWYQYDLLFIPLISGMSLCAATTLLSLIKGHARAALFLGTALSLYIFSGWDNSVEDLSSYFRKTDKRYRLLSTRATDEHIDSLNLQCSGLGFEPHASFMIIKSKATMAVHEMVEGKDLYGASYRDLLEAKKVRFLVGGTNISAFPAETKSYLRANYRYQDCIWRRVTEFGNGP